MAKATTRVSGLSLLESANLKGATLTDYCRRSRELLDWMEEQHRDWTDDPALDANLCEFLDMKYAAGAPADGGAKVICAVQFLLPQSLLSFLWLLLFLSLLKCLLLLQLQFNNRRQ